MMNKLKGGSEEHFDFFLNVVLGGVFLFLFSSPPFHSLSK
jgi:hypothetical protein